MRRYWKGSGSVLRCGTGRSGSMRQSRWRMTRLLDKWPLVAGAAVAGMVVYQFGFGEVQFLVCTGIVMALLLLGYRKVRRQ